MHDGMYNRGPNFLMIINNIAVATATVVRVHNIIYTMVVRVPIVHNIIIIILYT